MRRFGGDLQGILERLDHIQSLGVTALLLNPVFEAPSAGRRDAAALHHVDNNLGPDPDGDRLVWATENPADPATWKWTTAPRLLLRLVQECHRRQMKLVLDGVFDHVGVNVLGLPRPAKPGGEPPGSPSWFIQFGPWTIRRRRPTSSTTPPRKGFASGPSCGGTATPSRKGHGTTCGRS